MYPRVSWVQQITVIEYRNTFNYLKTTNIFQHDVDIELYNYNHKFFCVRFIYCLWQLKGDSMWSSAVYDMYDQLTIYILNINFIY